MIRKCMSGLFAICFVLALTVPLFAQQSEESKETPAMEKAEKSMAKSSGNAWVKSVQEALKAKGNDPGPIDGRMGSKTKAAVKAFQEANGLKGTGKIDKDTADKLGVEMPKMSMHHHKTEKKEESTQTKP